MATWPWGSVMTAKTAAGEAGMVRCDLEALDRGGGGAGGVGCVAHADTFAAV